MPLPRGDLGTGITVMAMRSLARQGMRNPRIRELALAITHSVGGADGEAQVNEIRDFIDDHVEFTRDPAGQELLYTPDRMARLLTDPARDGILRIDCDDVAILAAALGGTVGLRSRFVVVGFLYPRAPFAHVWTELSPPAGPGASTWQEVDVTRPAQALPSAISRKWTVNV